MARFRIISKDGKSIRFEGKPRYIGSYLKPSYLEFSEIASPTPIKWQVGDYVDYPRTGMRYRLYSIPQASKNASKGSHGRAFTYSNVQLHSATKELEIALFRDLVDNDNNIHFSTSPDVATFENVEGIARRIQACMDDLYPGRWEIRIADFHPVLNADVIEVISEAKDFAMSGGTCLDALTKIYELWEGIGWFHTYENGKDVITIGYANTMNAGNTSEPYLYGKGNGLTAIKKSQTNKDEFATRLYVYGSERNLPPRYYNGLDILHYDSVDIRNLMLPLASWGKTNGLPDARLAYLENAEAVSKFGIIPKVHYFDSADSGADIYPSVEGMTVGHLRKVLADMGESEYSPSLSIYPDDAERVDMVLSAVNPTDEGVLNKGGKEYEETKGASIGGSDTVTVEYGSTETFFLVKTIAEVSFAKIGSGEITLNPNGHEYVVEGISLENVYAVFDLSIANRTVATTKNVLGSKVGENAKQWSVAIPSMTLRCTDREYSSYDVKLKVAFYVTPYAGPGGTVNIRTASNNPMDVLSFGFKRLLSTKFTIDIKQVGFDIALQASKGKGKTISMKSGACMGRNFTISNCTYYPSTDSWRLECKRQQDNTLGILFPYKDYPIEAGDKFVLLDIAMPEVYIRASMERLLAEGERLLARASKVQTHYEPSIDAKVMVESGRVLREGMFMSVTDEDVIDNTTDYIIIDTLSIYEDESAIPTYKVTLRERRKVTYKGTPSATSSTDTESAGEETQQAEVDLSDYYTKREVDDKIKDIDVTEQLADYATNSSVDGKVNRAIDQVQYWVNSKGYATQKYVTTETAKVQENVDALAERVTATEGGIETLEENKADKTSVTALDQKYESTKAWHDRVSPLLDKEGGNINVSTNLIVEGDIISDGSGEIVDSKNKGYYQSYESLAKNYPTASAGDIAFVGVNYPYAIYQWDADNAKWADTGQTGGQNNIPLGDYYTKNETMAAIDAYHVILSQEAYDALEEKEDKLYFTFED